MNKPTFEYLRPETQEFRPITRGRVAYLLRAARSRRPGNIRRIGRGFAINDSNFRVLLIAL